MEVGQEAPELLLLPQSGLAGLELRKIFLGRKVPKVLLLNGLRETNPPEFPLSSPRAGSNPLSQEAVWERGA